jgi:type VI secretion system Hcp family effector
VVTKEADSASPQLLQAHWTNEVIDSVILQFFRPGTGGKETVAERITLTNAVISKIGYAPPLKGKRREAVTLTYEELTVNGLKNGIIPHYLLG